MPRVLALLALLLPAVGFAQDTVDSADTDTSYTPGEGVAAYSGDDGGRPSCACSTGTEVLPLAPGLAATALLVRSRRRGRQAGR